ncbi:hypothetical protein BASA50_003208 [Batrachochytrium salamandrivorans]|uniref:HAM1-like N-terminal domain-containing protein n=1 Tax=Batrachochytrium salamandrivorans TaxID=1357716 RepID=A0ABQ8FJ47_9FUNG|nr:hypothetical protein BASA50_003208 [Batrachochytrium salamandrivorans]
MTIIEIIAAFQNGRLPSNAQIDDLLLLMRYSNAMTSITPSLSPQGQQLWSSIQSALDTLHQAVHECNKSESIQNMMYHLGLAQPLSSMLPAMRAATSARTGSKVVLGAETMVEHIGTLGTLLESMAYGINSKEIEAETDSSKKAQEINPQSSVSASNDVVPTGEIQVATKTDIVGELSQMSPKQQDQRASESYPTAQSVKDTRALDISKIPSQPAMHDASPAKTLKGTTPDTPASSVDQGVGQSMDPSDPSDAKRMGKMKSDERAKESGQVTWSDGIRHGTLETKFSQSSLMARTSIASGIWDTTSESSRNIGMTNAEMLELSGSMIRTVMELSESRLFHALATHLFAMAKTQLEISVSIPHTTTPMEVRDANSDLALTHLKRLVEDLLGESMLDSVVIAVEKFRTHMSVDKILCGILKHGISILEKSIDPRNEALLPELTITGASWLGDIRTHLKSRYPDESYQLVRQISAIFNTISANPYILNLASKMQRISSTIWMFRDNQSFIHPHLIRDFLVHIIPLTIREIRSVPIPQVVHRSPSYDITLDTFNFDTNSITPGSIQAKVPLMTDIMPYVRNVPFTFTTRGILPSFTDSGLASIKVIGDTGYSVLVDLNMFPETPDKTISVSRIDVGLAKLGVSITGTKRDYLYRMFTPILGSLLKAHLSKAITAYITESVSTIDKILTSIKATSGPPQSLDGQINCQMDMFLCALGLDGGATESLIQENIKTEQQRLTERMTWQASVTNQSENPRTWDEMREDVDTNSPPSMVGTVLNSKASPWYWPGFDVSPGSTRTVVL